MKHSFTVQNIKCGGCANSIVKSLREVKGVDNVEVDIPNGIVTLDGQEDLDQKAILIALKNMGYPSPGEGNLLTTATSYVSCMIGRVM
jgi:copper chaperone